MNYKKNASSNRDALFGSAASGGGNGNNKKSSSSSRPATSDASSSATTSRAASSQQPQITARGYQGSKGSKSDSSRHSKQSLLSPEARAAKLKEAQDYQAKAQAAMQPGLFKRPDPLAASTYYKRAAECYGAIGDSTQERYYRVSSGQCNVQIGAWASAAQDYTRAAELVLQEKDSRELSEQDCTDASLYHQQAAKAWTEQNETAKAAASQVAAALALNAGSRGTLLSQASLAGMEVAIEAHVPDVLNPMARYRQTGHSSFIDPDSNETLEHPSPQTLAMAKEHLVSRSYAHEPLQQLIDVLVSYGEYASALYAAGAVSTLLSSDGISTLSLSRAFVIESILQLALGDPVGAEQTFLNRHCNSRSYLSSREAQLSEELMRAIKSRDVDALEQVRSPQGPNRTALANLPPSVRTLVGQLRVSGVARKQLVDTTAPIKHEGDEAGFSGASTGPSAGGASSKPTPPSLQELMSKKTGYEQEAEEGAALDGNQLAAELDDLDFGDDGSGSNGDDNGSLEDDDDLDLR